MTQPDPNKVVSLVLGAALHQTLFLGICLENYKFLWGANCNCTVPMAGNKYTYLPSHFIVSFDVLHMNVSSLSNILEIVCKGYGFTL